MSYNDKTNKFTYYFNLFDFDLSHSKLIGSGFLAINTLTIN